MQKLPRQHCHISCSCGWLPPFNAGDFVFEGRSCAPVWDVLVRVEAEARKCGVSVLSCSAGT